MPQKWSKDSTWYQVDCYDENGDKIDKNNTQLFFDTRNTAVKSLGNFALLTSSLNSTVSNSAFAIKIDGNGKHSGMRTFAASLTTTKAIIDFYDSSKVWDETTVYIKEKEYFDILNGFYQFE